MIHDVQDLFDPQRHEPLNAPPWHPDLACEAIARICAAAEDEFDETTGSWLLHPADDPAQPGARSLNLYWGASGVVWALRHLAGAGAVQLERDYSRWVAQYPDGVREEAAHEQHGTASYLFGESSALLLAWMDTRRDDFADRLHEVVRSNLHNPAHEPLWGNSGTALAAIHMAEATGEGRWQALVAECIQALIHDMVVDPETGTWLWHQDLYGKPTRYLGAGHGLAGNAFAVLRGARFADPALVDTALQRVLETLSATALHARLDTAGGERELINWHVLVDRHRIAAWLAQGGRPLVQDCHGAPGMVCRLSTVPHTDAWALLLRGAGELTWHAGPLAKGPSLCHGTAGSAMACLKLWRRWGEPVWLDRARALALHAAGQVEAARARHGAGRHSLWTGDLGVGGVLWNCVVGGDGFPTLDHHPSPAG
jgi:Lanthionine synthetase C-like protein